MNPARTFITVLRHITDNVDPIEKIQHYDYRSLFVALYVFINDTETVRPTSS